MDPASYLTFAAVAVKTVQLCAVLKDALRGHDASRRRLVELEEIVNRVRRSNVNDDAEAPPALRDILEELEKFYREYESAGQPGRGMGQVARRIRVVFSDDELQKKYNRLMVHMTSEIYAEIKGARTPNSNEMRVTPTRSNTGLSGTTLAATSPTQPQDPSKSFKARMLQKDMLSEPRNGMIRRLSSTDLADREDAMKAPQVFPPPRPRRQSQEGQAQLLAQGIPPPTPSPPADERRSPTSAYPPPRQPSSPSERRFAQPLPLNHRLPSPPVDDPPQQAAITRPRVLVQQPSDASAMEEEEEKPRVFPAGRVTIIVAGPPQSMPPLELLDAKYTIEDEDDAKLLTMWDGGNTITHRIPPDQTGIPYTRVPFEEPWKTTEISFLVPAGSPAHDISLQRPDQPRPTTIPASQLVVYRVHGSDSRPGKPSRYRLLLEQRLRGCPQLRVFKCLEARLLLASSSSSAQAEATASVYVKLWRAQSWQRGARVEGPSLSFARRHEAHEELPLAASFERVLVPAPTKNADHVVWRLVMRSGAPRLLLSGRKGAASEQARREAAGGGAALERAGSFGLQSRRQSMLSVVSDTSSTASETGRRAGSMCSAIELKFEKHLGIQFQTAWNDLWRSIDDNSRPPSRPASITSPLSGGYGPPRNFTPHASPSQMARIDEETEQNDPGAADPLMLPPGVMEGVPLQLDDAQSRTRRTWQR